MMETEVRKCLEESFKTLMCYFSDDQEFISDWMEECLWTMWNRWYITDEEYKKAKKDLHEWRDEKRKVRRMNT